MDPNIMKFLEEDEDETMHSRAAVEAFTAELNRDIEGNASTSHQRSDSDSAALSRGSCQTERPILPQWQTSSHNGIGHFQRGQDPIFMEQKEQHLSQLELQQPVSDSDYLKQEDDSSNELNSLPFLYNPSTYACPQLKDNPNSLPVSRPMSMQTSREQTVHIQEPDCEPNPQRESQRHKLRDMSNQQFMEIGSNNQQPVAIELNDQQPWSTGKGNLQTTSIGLNNEQAMVTVKQHTIGMGMSSQQAMISGISNQQSFTSGNQQPGTTLKLNKQVSFGMLLQIIQPQLDKDRAMQVHTLSFRLKKNEISKDGFFRHLRSIVGDQMLRLAAYKLQTQAARNSQTAPCQFQSQHRASARQLQMSSSAQMTTDICNPATDSNKMRSREVENQADSSGERKLPAFAIQELKKQQLIVGNSYSHSSAAKAASSTAKTWLILTQMNSNTTLQQNLVQWPLSTSKEQKIGVSSSVRYIKQELLDQSNEHHHKDQMSFAQIKQGNAAPGNLKDYLSHLESDSHHLRAWYPQISKSQMPSLTSPIGPGNSSKAPMKNPLVDQKKPTEAPDSSSTPSSKKQKVSLAFLDQSIEQLNDVTAISGVNLREEEEHLFSGPKEDSRVSEASRQVVQEEDRLILHKIPLQKKLVEIMAKYGLKSTSNDVERCLSLCVEDRMRGLISNLIRLSKQHIDVEKRHRTIITSDVRQQIMTINGKAREEWEKKQAATEKSQKLNEPERTTGVDGDKEKDESRVRSAKAYKEEDDKMRTTAANDAVRAATGVGDMLSRWQLMIEAKQKQGAIDASYGSQPGKDARKPLPASTRNNSENQEAEKQDHSASFDTPALVRKVGRNQVIVPWVARCITVRDVIAILEKEPQMSKSTLIYQLYEKVSTDAVGE
ncbi:hypothetical protein Pfo_021939 [Paulownia fortunei]|nr:hypothetical protein Pfo_021939 [Paulownia fortunei]